MEEYQQQPQWRATIANLQEGLGDILELTGNHEAAREAFNDANRYLEATKFIEQARLARKIGRTWEHQRTYTSALEATEKSLELIERLPEKSDGDWWADWLPLGWQADCDRDPTSRPKVEGD